MMGMENFGFGGLWFSGLFSYFLLCSISLLDFGQNVMKKKTFEKLLKNEFFPSRK